MRFVIPTQPLVGLIVLLIIGFFVYGLWQLWSLRQRLDEEVRAVDELRARDMLVRSDTIELALGNLKSTFAGRLLTDMAHHSGMAFARLSDVTEPLLDDVDRLSARIRPLPNLILLLGLIGTVVGLIFTLGSLGPQIQGAINAGDPKVVSEKLGITLKEMSSAFAGTFWGVFLTFVLQGLNALVLARQGHLMSELEKIGAQYAIKVFPASSEKQLQSLQDLVMRSEAFLQATQEKITETSERFADVLRDAGGTIQASLEKLQETSGEISKALLQASGEVKHSSGQLTEAANAIQRHREDFRNIYASFNDMFNESMKSLKLHSDSQLKEIRDLQAGFGATGAEVVGQLLNTTERLGLVSSDLQTSQSAYLTGVQQTEHAIREGFGELDNKIGKTLQQYTQEVGLVSHHLDHFSSQLSPLAEATTKLNTTLLEKDKVEYTRLKDREQRENLLLGEQEKLVGAIHDLNAIIRAYQSQPELLTQLITAQNDKILTVQEAQQHLHGQLSSGIQDIARLSVGQKQQSDALIKQLEELKTMLFGLLDQATSMSDRWPDTAAQHELMRHMVTQATETRQAIERLPAEFQSQEVLHGTRELHQVITQMLSAMQRETPAQGASA